MLAGLLSLIPNLLGMGTDYLEGKRKLKQVQLESELAVTHAVTKANLSMAEAGQAQDISWAQQQTKNSGSSWKDEYWTIVLSIPAVMSFVPMMSPYVVQGFEALSTTPDWYQTVLLVAISAAFGVQVWKKVKP